jgi:type VI secretion system protein ImpH
MEAMATDERPPSGPLIDKLVARPQGFNLFQAISLLERRVPGRAAVGTSHGGDEAVRLTSVVSLGFQASDVANVAVPADPDAPARLATSALSLAGAEGPLPLPFTELVLERAAARDHATADFLDIFNQRIIAFLYRSRKKHHIGLNWASPQSSALARCLDGVSALGLQAGVRGPHGEVAWLRHAGLLGGAPRSMAGLLAMLADRFAVKAGGTQFCGGWRDLEPADVARLSTRGSRAGARLGASAVLGKRVWDQGAGIRVTLSDLPLARLLRFLRGQDEYARAKWMIRRYVQQDLDVELELRLRPGERVRSVLSRAEPMRLGWTSWVVGAGRPAAGLPPTRFTMADAASAAAAA